MYVKKEQSWLVGFSPLSVDLPKKRLDLLLTHQGAFFSTAASSAAVPKHSKECEC